MMGIVVDWDNEAKTILKGEVALPWTWDELFATWATAVNLINSVPYPVHLIVLAESASFPEGNILVQLNRIVPNGVSDPGHDEFLTDNPQ